MATYMDSLIPIVNRIQDTFASIGLPLSFELPQIAVVGSQSAGKSSVLENIVGRDFLPRGSGIVTRRPLVLQLIQHNVEYAEFLHLRDKKFVDFDQVRREIEAETDRVTGSNKNISSLPINLRVYSPHVLNLTLIDLPGITKVPIGDQPADIETQIRKMVMQFIAPESCLILAVTPANMDLANSDSLKIAKEVDPHGVRTIGVLTKLDLMDEGTNARDILENKVLPLRRGYVGVVNRSQKDIDGKKNITQALESERRYFMSHPVYGAIADKCGTAYLQKLLHQELSNHIKDSLPQFTKKLQSMLNCLEPKVNEYGKMITDDHSMRNKQLTQYINVFCAEFGNELSGTALISVDMENLTGGAKINRIFHERFPFELYKVQQDDRIARREISVAIRNIIGYNTGIFTPDLAFGAVVRSRISRLREPSMLCVDLVTEELHNIVRKIGEKVRRLPNLRMAIERTVIDEIRRLEATTKEQLETQIEIQLAYMNTNHEDFIGCTQALKGMQAMDAKPERIQTVSPQQLPTSSAMTGSVIRKGWLTMLSGGFMKGFNKELWFVLTTESLTVYKQADEKEKKFQFAVEGLRMKDLDTGGVTGKKPAFVLFYPERLDGSNSNLAVSSRAAMKDLRQLELVASSSEEAENWKASFMRVNIYPVSYRDGGADEPSEVREDSGMERQVDMVCTLVESYLKIVTKMHRDVVPKTIACLLINKMREFLRSELLLQLCSTSKLEELTAEPPEEARRREETMKTYKAVKEALKIVAELNVNTVTTPLPPPIDVTNHSFSQNQLLIPQRKAPAPPRAMKR